MVVDNNLRASARRCTPQSRQALVAEGLMELGATESIAWCDAHARNLYDRVPRL
jgi:hypothetical protein